MNLRPAREDDLPALIALARRSWLGGFGDSAPESFVREWLARDFEREWYPRYWMSMTVAELEGILLGIVQPMGDEINGLWVDTPAQGRGVGTSLLRHAERQIAEAGHLKAWLSCSGFNPKAQGFYLAKGYRWVKTEIKPRAEGVLEEMLYFERVLTLVEQD